MLKNAFFALTMFALAWGLVFSSGCRPNNNPAVIAPPSYVPACAQGYCASYNPSVYPVVGCPPNYVAMPSAEGYYCLSQLVYQNTYSLSAANPYPQMCDSYNGNSCGGVRVCIAINSRYGTCQ